MRVHARRLLYQTCGRIGALKCSLRGNWFTGGPRRRVVGLAICEAEVLDTMVELVAAWTSGVGEASVHCWCCSSVVVIPAVAIACGGWLLSRDKKEKQQPYHNSVRSSKLLDFEKDKKPRKIIRQIGQGSRKLEGGAATNGRISSAH